MTRLPLDAHLMIAEPARYVAQFAEAGARMISVHVEAETHLHRTLMEIKRHGALAGVAINPATPLVLLEEALPYADYVVLMAVNPGFSGQAFIPTTIDKLRRLRRMIVERRVATRIEVDGGINPETAQLCVEAGAQVLVAGSSVFNGRASVAENLQALRGRS